ncbi:unnamed protein product [Pleuronectes platessa]|uniref:Uncharacterized protein n=1 Tax=Pleuronectes platessa TaxID=8262 RepID=A0A9N7TWK0_PLEPL|nr:unnamed protein product [Pleuronectes platessa]
MKQQRDLRDSQQNQYRHPPDHKRHPRPLLSVLIHHKCLQENGSEERCGFDGGKTQGEDEQCDPRLLPEVIWDRLQFHPQRRRSIHNVQDPPTTCSEGKTNWHQHSSNAASPLQLKQTSAIYCSLEFFTG